MYGQDAGFPERSMVIYDGLHYDALAVAGQTLLNAPSLDNISDSIHDLNFNLCDICTITCQLEESREPLEGQALAKGTCGRGSNVTWLRLVAYPSCQAHREVHDFLWTQTCAKTDCTLAAFPDAPEELDVTIFDVQGGQAEAISRAAATLVEKVSFARCFLVGVLGAHELIWVDRHQNPSSLH